MYSSDSSGEKLGLAKRLWFSLLSEFTPAQIDAAANRVMRESEYLPTVSRMVKYCTEGEDIYGLPSAREAYIEACTAPSPKNSYHWSHPAVYYAGLAADWFFLANTNEARALPVFERHYQLQCDRVRRGEVFSLPTPTALPESLPTQLSAEEQLQAMQRLRAELKI